MCVRARADKIEKGTSPQTRAYVSGFLLGGELDACLPASSPRRCDHGNGLCVGVASIVFVFFVFESPTPPTNSDSGPFCFKRQVSLAIHLPSVLGKTLNKHKKGGESA